MADEKTRIEVSAEEPKTHIEISDGMPKESKSLEDSEFNLQALIPFAVPVLIVILVVFAFASFGKKEVGPLSGVDLNEATKSASVAGTQAKAVAQGPKVPPKKSPSPSPEPTPSPELSPTPSPSPENNSNNNNPEPLPDPSPSPLESPTPLP